ncbi:MAG: Thiamine-phosphate synthase [Arcobacter lacus]|nr:MAG: Thiamine-phosphate synthase [Arcobacter lacus]
MNLQKYLITDPKYYGQNKEEFQKNLTKALKDSNANFVCFRDKLSENYKELIEVFIAVCKAQNIKNIFINTYINEAKKHNVGVHLTSTQFDKIKECKEQNLQVIVSCHTQEDIDYAIKNGADYITYSPIFESPGKSNFKGIEKLKQTLEKNSEIKIFALGGIVSEDHIKQIQSTKCFGFASIRYFV